MIQFSFHRFKKLACWSLVNDKRYYVKSFLQVMVILLLMFLFFTILTRTNMGQQGNYGPCAFIANAIIIVTIVMGPAFMFYSMEGKHDQQRLMMLPASNFEKYLMRYSTWMILLPLYIVAFFAADLLQYIIHGVMGHDYAMFVTSVIVKFFNEVPLANTESSPHLLDSTALVVVWSHSIYALGATFFRSRKFNWIMTTVVIILIGILANWLTREDSDQPFDWKVSELNYRIGVVIYICWTLLNFWLSYRLFCRNQVIGKYVNL
ncbi:MAG: hypothetical protein IJ081_04490 [Prevotella sp.]|nr:hypothetical protein [Prevotella sp.]